MGKWLSAIPSTWKECRMEINNLLKKLKEERYLPGPEIVNIYKIFGTLKTVAPLHIGSGQFGKAKDRDSEDGENCALIERDYCGRPCIPGSSLKGIIRSWLETNLLPFNTSGKYDVASLSTAESDDIQKGITNNAIEEKKKNLRKETNGKNMSDAETERYVICGMAKFYLENLDIVSGLFGVGRFRGKIEVNTAYIKHPDQWNDSKIFTMPGVAIDRITGTAKDKSLFAYELVAPEEEFKVEISARNVRYWELGMMLTAMNAFNHSYFPLKLGGLTNNGYGQMHWEAEKIYQMGDDDRAITIPKIREDFKIISFDTNSNLNWEKLSIEKRGFVSIKAFEEHCIYKLGEELDKLSGGKS